MAARSSAGISSGVGQGTYESGRGEQEAPRAQLPCLARAVGGAIQELAGELVPREPPVADELAQGVLGADAEQVVQLFAETSTNEDCGRSATSSSRV